VKVEKSQVLIDVICESTVSEYPKEQELCEYWSSCAAPNSHLLSDEGGARAQLAHIIRLRTDDGRWMSQLILLITSGAAQITRHIGVGPDMDG